MIGTIKFQLTTRREKEERKSDDFALPVSYARRGEFDPAAVSAGKDTVETPNSGARRQARGRPSPIARVFAGEDTVETPNPGARRRACGLPSPIAATARRSPDPAAHAPGRTGAASGGHDREPAEPGWRLPGGEGD